MRRMIPAKSVRFRHRDFLLLIVLITGVGGTHAYTLECDAANTVCTTYCDNKEKAGEMFWNGSQWSDGVRWDVDKNVVARGEVKAMGGACT